MTRNFLEEEIKISVQQMYPELLLPRFEVSVSEHADYASNIALTLSALVDMNPRLLAEKIQNALLARLTLMEAVTSVEVAGPGFLNFMVGEPLLVEGMNELEENISKGFSFLSGTKENIEFISANPTGKLHIGHGRGAFFGDVLANVMEFSGSFVTREFYVNNSRESKQIVELGKTARGEGEQYKTTSLEEKIKKLDFGALNESEAGFLLAKRVQEENVRFVENELKVKFDIYYSEDEQLRAKGKIEKMRKRLESEGFAYEKEGALWLKTSEYGDDEDRVLVRSDGKASYFLGDIAYHDDKFSRGLDGVFNVWGADHQGHVQRMQAVKKMLGWQGEFCVFIAQLVMLKSEEGERAKMSKRAGNVVLLEDLVEAVGIDVVRWFFLERSLSTQMDFNLDLAKENSEKNPVRYVQYAHARMCSIIEKSKISPERLTFSKVQPSGILKEVSARALATKLIQLSDVIEEITKNYAVNQLTTYVYELAEHFSAFYRDVRVIEKDESVNEEALAMVVITKKTIAKCLELLGISAPDHM